MTHVLEWQFGGWLRELSPAAAWSVLGASALIGLCLVIWIYRRTLTNLSRRARLALTALRVAMVLLVLLCLANPTRVERKRPEPPKRELAVLVDHSGSMCQRDYRGETRLADAVRIWKPHEAEAAASYSTVSHWQFADGLSSAPDFNAAVNAGKPGTATHLYSALDKELKKNPAAIVCLTDGLDTTTNNTDGLIAEAQRRGVPLYFVVGKNRSRVTQEMLAIHEVDMPASVLRNSKFTASALLEVVAPQEGNVPVELWSGGKKLASAVRSVHPGLNSLPWSVQVKAGEPGLMPLEFRLGSGAQQQTALRSTHIVGHTKINLLYYQGALQWGYRFLRGALESDPSFHLTAILNPSLGVHMVVGEAGANSLTDLPEDPQELKRFQIVVLAHAFADMMTPKQQRALMSYVQDGGSVLFISPDAEATARFSGTLLEQMLPVVFEPPNVAQAMQQRDSRQQTRITSSAPQIHGTSFVTSNLREQSVPKLKPFVPVGEGKKLFPPGPDAPKFCTYAPVRSVKPGAEILAVHPTDRSPYDNSRCVLLARERFGNGNSAVLDTDLLWRWKLSIPSSSHAVETFWQQLMLSLAQPPSSEQLQLTRVTDSPQLDHPVTVRISGAPKTAPAVIAVSPAGTRETLNATEANNGRPGDWQTVFTPDREGRWSIHAGNANGDLAGITFNVTAHPTTTELMNLPPDTEGLRRIAEATGGALIEDGTPVFRPELPERPVEIVRAQALWNNGWLALLMFGAYAAELVARRIYKLL